MIPVPAPHHHPLFALAEAAGLVLTVGALGERSGRTSRLLPFFLAATAVGLLAAGDAPLGARLVAVLVLALTAVLVPVAGRRTAHLASGGAAASVLRVAAALALVVLGVVFASLTRPSGEPVAIALAIVLVGLFAASVPAPDAVRLLRLVFPGGGLALLAASLPGVPAALLVLPVLVPLAALALGSAILGRVAAFGRAPS